MSVQSIPSIKNQKAIREEIKLRRKIIGKAWEMYKTYYVTYVDHFISEIWIKH